MLPIVNIARFLALSSQVTISPTLDRLVALEELNSTARTAPRYGRRSRSPGACASLTTPRASRHGRPPDNSIDAKALPPFLRQDVREAFRAIAAAQKKLSVWVPAGI
jgi:signal-transduction protein with cAMP-binding, CBS, and nucleotidyltransferase domain